jgi:glycerate 2-kinase
MLTEQALARAPASVPPGSPGRPEDFPCVCIAAGKAAPAMARAAARHRQVRAGLVVSATPPEAPLDRFTVIVGGHPMPTPTSEEAGRAALELAGSVKPRQELLVFLSGGASALMAVPAEGLTLENKQRTTSHLLREGADIHSLNTVRKHLSAIKGGRLAARCPGVCRTLAISDVVGDDLSVIASGPTVGDASTFRDALDVLTRFGGEAAYPAAVVDHFRRATDDTPKPGDASLSRASTTLIGSRVDAMAGAESEARARGYRVVVFDGPVTGEARVAAAAHLCALLAMAQTVPRPLCVISSGETTVRVTGRGRGGRNQEFALAMAEPLAEQGVDALIASVGTDGIDGPTDAAGAVVGATTLERGRRLGLSPDRSLADNDSYTFFEALGDLVRTGPTGTNVGDLQVILLA